MVLSLIKNFLSLAGAEAFTKLITFAAFAYLARLFGPAGFGIIEWSIAILMCASLIVDQGFSAYGAREIAKAPEKSGRLVAEVVSARFLLAFISYSAIAVFSFLYVQDDLIRQLLLIYGLSLWALPLFLQWAFQGHDRMHLVSVTQIIRQSIFVSVIFIFVRNSGDLLMVGVAEVAAVVIAALFSVWMYNRNFEKVMSLRPTLSAKLFREGVPIGISQMFWVVKMFGATLILGLVATAEDTGYFAGAMRILVALHTFVWLYYFNLLPSFSRAWQDGGDKMAAIIGNSMRIVLLLSLFGGTVWVLTAPYAMTIAYGEDFLSGSGALQWMAGVCVAAAISGHYRFGLIAAGFQKREMATAAFGAALVAVLIPVGYFHSRTSGAAAGLLVAEIGTLVLSWVFARRLLFSSAGSRPEENGMTSLPEALR